MTFVGKTMLIAGLALLPGVGRGERTEAICDSGQQWKWVIPPHLELECALPFSEGMSAANVGGGFQCLDAKDWNGGKWGFFDRAGRNVTGFRYDDASSFHEGLAAVNIGSTWGESGEIVNSGKWSLSKNPGAGHFLGSRPGCQ